MTYCYRSCSVTHAIFLLMMHNSGSLLRMYGTSLLRIQTRIFRDLTTRNRESITRRHTRHSRTVNFEHSDHERSSYSIFSIISITTFIGTSAMITTPDPSPSSLPCLHTGFIHSYQNCESHRKTHSFRGCHRMTAKATTSITKTHIPELLIPNHFDLQKEFGAR